MVSLNRLWRRKSSVDRSRRTILITGGGTAGHTNPGIAVAQALVELGFGRDQIHFVGGARGNEGELVPAAGFSIDLVAGRGIQRRLTPANIGAVLGLVGGMFKALAIVAKRRPAAVLCLGGYAAFAASAAAVVLRVPLVVSEQNARASAVNRLFGRFAKRCALPFPATDLPNGVVTGNPIRSNIVEAVTEADRHKARQALFDRFTAAGLGLADDVDPNSVTLIAVWAGSLGATRINRAVLELAERWADRPDAMIFHVVGHRDWDGEVGDVARSGLSYLRVPYEDDMPTLLVAADLAVCRAGASTVAELSVAGLPSILVPFPQATRDHQRANTQELDEAGAAIVVDDGTVDGAALDELLDPLVTDPARREAMAQAARSVARPRAALDVAQLLIDTGGIEPPGRRP